MIEINIIIGTGIFFIITIHTIENFLQTSQQLNPIHLYVFEENKKFLNKSLLQHLSLVNPYSLTSASTNFPGLPYSRRAVEGGWSLPDPPDYCAYISKLHGGLQCITSWIFGQSVPISNADVAMITRSLPSGSQIEVNIFSFISTVATLMYMSIRQNS